MHRGSIAVLDADGRLVYEMGDVEGPIFPRSSNKPMQALGMLRSGYQPRDTADLALAAASHHGEPMHVDRVHAMLEASGLDVSDLACPPDLPTSTDAPSRPSFAPEATLSGCI